MWRVNVQFVEISGNRHSIRKRIDTFSGENNQIAVLEQRTVGFAPIRIHRLTHVIFIGGTSTNTVNHWTTRAVTPINMSSLPEAIFIQSVYDEAFHL
jgi:hypothetical protein